MESIREMLELLQQTLELILIRVKSGQVEFSIPTSIELILELPITNELVTNWFGNDEINSLTWVRTDDGTVPWYKDWDSEFSSLWSLT